MCDEPTAEELRRLAKGVNRRQFGAMGAAAAALAGCASHGEADAATASARLAESTVRIPTPDGEADAFFVHPASGVHPGVVLWPDIAGLRDAFKAVARRLAGEGYAVLVVNHYYRGGAAPFVSTFTDWQTPAGQTRLRPLIAGITPERTLSDARAFAGFLDGQAAVDKARGIGTQGYCMGGAFAVRTAAAMPGRVGAVASFHGGGLVLDKADSPHRLIAATRASFLFAVARNDDMRAPDDKDVLRRTAAEAKRPAEIEVYQADHGWCVPDSPKYDRAEADRAWARLLALYAGL